MWTEPTFDEVMEAKEAKEVKEKNRARKSALRGEVDVEVLRLSSSDSLRMTRIGKAPFD
jgi:hypothetical protein